MWLLPVQCEDMVRRDKVEVVRDEHGRGYR
jgi:hypothetical protein